VTVTVKLHQAESPDGSTAWNATNVVGFTGKAEPEVRPLTRLREAPQLSETVGVVYVKALEHKSGSVKAEALDRQPLMTGGVVSITVTKKLHAADCPDESVTV